MNYFANSDLSLPASTRHNGEMRRRSVPSLVIACLLFILLFSQPRRLFAQMGYKGQDLGRIGQWLALYHLQLYRLEIPNYASPYSVLLTSGRHGWRIVVFLRDGGVANVDWDSGFLPRTFQYASTDALVLVPQVGKNFGVTFSGCAIQDCTQNYSALLYLPWSRQFFEKTISSKSVTCSQALLDPRNAAALLAIDAALKRQQTAIPEYSPPACPGWTIMSHP
jgi:hypothetical protein